jgi:hypothetical protein
MSGNTEKYNVRRAKWLGQYTGLARRFRSIPHMAEVGGFDSRAIYNWLADIGQQDMSTLQRWAEVTGENPTVIYWLSGYLTDEQARQVLGDDLVDKFLVDERELINA